MLVDEGCDVAARRRSVSDAFALVLRFCALVAGLGLAFPVLAARSADTHDQKSGTSPEVPPLASDDGNFLSQKAFSAATERQMTAAQIQCNPEVDYTRYAARDSDAIHGLTRSADQILSRLSSPM